MRAASVAIVCVFLALACNKKATEADVDEGIENWNALWDGYYKALEDNQGGDTDKMIAAGQAYIDGSKDLIGKVKKFVQMRGDQSQIDRVKAAVEEGNSKNFDRLAELGKAMGQSEGMTTEKLEAAANQIQGQVQDLLDKVMK